eukprot:4246270-Prymnesium_polylepis.1
MKYLHPARLAHSAAQASTVAISPASPNLKSSEVHSAPDLTRSGFSAMSRTRARIPDGEAPDT